MAMKLDMTSAELVALIEDVKKVPLTEAGRVAAETRREQGETRRETGHARSILLSESYAHGGTGITAGRTETLLLLEHIVWPANGTLFPAVTTFPTAGALTVTVDGVGYPATVTMLPPGPNPPAFDLCMVSAGAITIQFETESSLGGDPYISGFQIATTDKTIASIRVTALSDNPRDEATDNAKYYMEQAQKAVGGNGVTDEAARGYAATAKREAIAAAAADATTKANQAETSAKNASRPKTWTPTAAQVGAAPITHSHTAAQVGAATPSYVDQKMQSGTYDPGVGSYLATGSIYLVYE